MKKVNIIKHSCTGGLGSTIMKLLHCLYYRDPNQLYYFDFYNSNYSDTNVWNTFFIQPFAKQIGTKEVQANYIYDIWKMGDFFLGYGKEQDIKYGKFQFKNTDRVNEIRNLVNNFVFFKQETLKHAIEFKDKHFNNQKVLGLHKRGSDMFSNRGHGYGQEHFLTIDNIKKIIDKTNKDVCFDKLFVATDEQKTVTDLCKYYGEKFILKQPTFLVPVNSTTSIQELNRNLKEEERKLRGLEMLGDAYLLSECNFCLNSRGSNVSLLSIFLRKNFNFTFIDDDVNYWHLG